MGAVGWGGLTWALLRLSLSLFAFGTLPSLSLLFPSSGHGCLDPLTPFAWCFVVKRGVGIDVGRGLLSLMVAVGGCWYPDGRHRGCWRSSMPVTWRLSAGMGAGVRGVLTVVVAIDVGGLGARQPR